MSRFPLHDVAYDDGDAFYPFGRPGFCSNCTEPDEACGCCNDCGEHADDCTCELTTVPCVVCDVARVVVGEGYCDDDGPKCDGCVDAKRTRADVETAAREEAESEMRYRQDEAERSRLNRESRKAWGSQ